MQTRLRRLRYNPVLREMVNEHHLSKSDLVMPLFVCPGEQIKNPVSSMPGIEQLSVDELVIKAQKLYDKGVRAVLLFGIPEHKDESGEVACESNGIVQQALRALKEMLPDLLLIADVCNCEYTTHGHCGPLVDGDVDNDQTVELLARQSVSLARAGADIVAPSDMMDGRIVAIRLALDQAGYYKTPVLSYAAKFASAFYGPFREAAGSSPQFGDRKSYQMNPANSREAIREVEMDVKEGADMVMVKPAMSYLDVIRQIKDRFLLPVVAYNVSGEYSMIKAAAEKGWIDEKKVVMEMLISMKRAGADIIISYFAEDVMDWMNDRDENNNRGHL